MTMTMDTQQRQLGGLSFDHHMQQYPGPPHFTNPWASAAPASAAASGPAPAQLFSAPSSSSSSSTSSAAGSSFGFDVVVKQEAASALPSYGGAAAATNLPVSAPAMSAGGMALAYGLPPPPPPPAPSLLNLSHDLLNAARLSGEPPYASDPAYSSAPPASSSSSPSSSSSSAAATSSTSATSSSLPSAYVATYDAVAFPPTRGAYANAAASSTAPAALAPQSTSERRLSQPAVGSSASFLAVGLDVGRSRPASMAEFGRSVVGAPPARNAYGRHSLEPARVVGAMSVGIPEEDEDATPRNIYGGQSRECADSYGFPSTHSSSSSVSSASGYPSYYGSMDSSLSEYSSTSESTESAPSRTLPRPSGFGGSSSGGSLPPAPQSMMGQFNSKVSSSGQKKHKCKVCDKRFTRPSSLQTHMYSHTGEKPFCCDVEGCGRHFSVVSNLRRHRKVHRGERETSSPDEM